MDERTASAPPGYPGERHFSGGTWARWAEPDWAGDGRLGGRHWRGGRRHWLGGVINGAPKGSGPLRRARADRVIGGVAAGIAVRTGVRLPVVRLVFVVTALTSGFGLVAYVLAWLFLPAEGESGAIAGRAMSDLRGIALAIVTTCTLVPLLVVTSILGVAWLSSFSGPLVVGAAGLILIWRNAGPDELASVRAVAQSLTSQAGAGGRSRIRLRIAVAGVLVVSGLGTLLAVRKTVVLLRPLAGVALLLAAIVVLLGPWWLRIARDLMSERQARVRAEERAEIAARVHDSVLQTLALIQRRADSPQQVVALARAQERELRSWLFDGRAPGSMDDLATTLASGVRHLQQDVEALHGIAVEVVTVGDSALDEDLAALLAAAREATVNAAKWSGAPVVSLFAEVEPDGVSVFVRDRGRGFDPAAVSADRKGLAESVRARMARHGGSAAVRSAPGEGTEVSLTMPRTAAGDSRDSKGSKGSQA
ncbi:MAG TPA: PspC domain-containing protein [Streptosporangiaceae bacterium]|nr:PspC domain-containing protein [Streptosporangiaceae bacterium]